VNIRTLLPSPFPTRTNVIRAPFGYVVLGLVCSCYNLVVAI